MKGLHIVIEGIIQVLYEDFACIFISLDTGIV